MARQVGFFFLIASSFGLFIFCASLEASQPYMFLALVSILGWLLGIFLIWRHPNQVTADERFRSLRKYRNDREKKRAGKREKEREEIEKLFK